MPKSNIIGGFKTLFNKSNLSVIVKTGMAIGASEILPGVIQKLSKKDMSGPVYSAASAAVVGSAVLWKDKSAVGKSIATAVIGAEVLKQMTKPINVASSKYLGMPMILPSTRGAVMTETPAETPAGDESLPGMSDEIEVIDENGNRQIEKAVRADDEVIEGVSDYASTEDLNAVPNYRRQGLNDPAAALAQAGGIYN